MKVGFIVECGPKGAETQVIPHLARRIAPSFELVEPVSLDSKEKLRRECGRWTKALLEIGCERVLILWDLMPDWGEYKGKGCRHDDKEQIYQSLKNAGVRANDKRIRLICIEKMMEAWLIADERALVAFLSTAAHAAKVPRCKNPEGVLDPKAALITLFGQSKSKYSRYVDRDHAIRIARLMPDLTRMFQSASFCRFVNKLTK